MCNIIKVKPMSLLTPKMLTMMAIMEGSIQAIWTKLDILQLLYDAAAVEDNLKLKTKV